MAKDNKHLVVDSSFVKEALKKDLSLSEFLLLLYFDNSFDSTFDTDIIARVLQMNENVIFDAYSKLLSKKLIKVKAEKDGYGKIKEIVSLDKFYDDIKMDTISETKEKNKDDIFSQFEQSFGRTLSSMDGEIINAWIDKGFSEELIKAALKEAVYNGTPNLRYIDKILYEWNRKGIKKPEDIKKDYLDDSKEDPLYETSLMNFNWLDEK